MQLFLLSDAAANMFKNLAACTVFKKKYYRLSSQS